MVKPIVHRHADKEGSFNPSEQPSFETFFTAGNDQETSLYTSRNLTPYAVKYSTAEENK